MFADTLIVVTPEGLIRDINSATCSLLKYEKDVLIGQPFKTLFAVNERPHIETWVDSLLRNEKIVGRDYFYRTKDGREIPVSLSGSVMQDKSDDGISIVCVAQDITDRLRSQTALRIAKEEAESASRAKSDFLANMSHELRTPMNHIIGFTDLVVGQNFGELNEVQTEYLTDVLQSSNHLLSLINDILDLSKVEAGKLELQPSCVDLNMLLENSLTMVKEKAMKQGIKLSNNINGIPDTITADERKLKQIMYNLLSNAVKFTPNGGEVSVTAQNCGLEDLQLSTVDSDQNCGIKINVSDTGIGLNPEDLDRIFNPFEQIESSKSRKFQGTGLGLSLTKSLVELHGGKIWVESEGEGKGSVFRFVIPININN